MEENEYVQKIHELEQELKIRIEDNAELYTKLCNALNQLNEANEVIKYFANAKIGLEQEDGRFIVGLAGFNGTKAQAIYYDPRPAEKYIKKWWVK